MVLQRACYLSINPQKDETLETEKAQYYLPDGSTIEVGDQASPLNPLRPQKLWTQTELPMGRLESDISSLLHPLPRAVPSSTKQGARDFASPMWKEGVTRGILLGQGGIMNKGS